MAIGPTQEELERWRREHDLMEKQRMNGVMQQIAHEQRAQQAYSTPRSRILYEAMEIVHKDRNANYGNPEDNFKQIAELWSAYKKQRFTTADVAVMNMLIKVARLSTNPAHHDSAVDVAGYAACLGDIQAAMQARGIEAAGQGGNPVNLASAQSFLNSTQGPTSNPTPVK